MLKKVPYALMVIGVVMLIGGPVIGFRSGDAPQIAFLMGLQEVVLLGFGLTIYMFTEGVEGRRTGCTRRLVPQSPSSSPRTSLLPFFGCCHLRIPTTDSARSC